MAVTVRNGLTIEAPGTTPQGHDTKRTGGRGRKGALVGLLLLVVLGVIVGGAVAVTTMSGASIAADTDGGLARITVQSFGGTLVNAVARDQHGHLIPLAVRDGTLTPRTHVAPGTALTVSATVKRPGWNGWALGKQSTKQVTVRTPTAGLRTKWTSVKSPNGLKVTFARPIARLSYGTPGHMRHVAVRHPRRTVDLGRQAAAGTLLVSAAPRSWEALPRARPVTWFPAGSTPTAVADPAPESQIAPTSKLALTFSKPVSALGKARPTFAAQTAGRWSTRDSHTLVFTPSGVGYGLGAHVQMTLPAGVQLVGGHVGVSDTSSTTGTTTTADDTVADNTTTTADDTSSTGATTTNADDTTTPGPTTVSWTVPGGSTLRLHELLAQLGYLPLTFQSDEKAIASDDGAQLQAAVDPPKGRFSWRWSLPSQLTSQWSPDTASSITRGALMAFQSDNDLTVDGLAGPDVWSSLINAVRAHRGNTFGYSYVLVHRDSAQQTATLIHNGRTIITTPANTGVPAAPTEEGTFPVYLRYDVTTMIGTNPDGTRYNDPGIRYVSYFNGGDALHAFNRASYGTPQSVGCVELPESAAATIYPYTPIGTLVQVAA
ncbi:MAG TPA: L,D-transpeptidase family protein [Conexibacter sp.]